MAEVKVNGISIKGISAAIPKNEVFNADYIHLSEKEKSRIIRTIGINSRREAPSNVTAGDLCEAAASKLLETLGWEKEEISILVLVTQTPDYITPCTATVLQDRLGLPTSCLAFDINLGCSAYPYGLSVVMSMLNSMPGGKGLLLVGDKSSHLVSSEDKSTALIFSDAGSATAIENDGKGHGIVFQGYSDGSGAASLIVKGGGCKYPVNEESLNKFTVSEGITRHELNLEMNGLNIYNFSIKQVVPTIKSFLEDLEITVEQVDYFIFHQANKIINSSMQKMLRIKDEQMVLSLDKFGNTSSASIPVTIVDQLGDRITKDSSVLLLSGFGVGLSWGNALIRTDSLPYIPIIEV
ncbi:MAG: ketoacyl-ACP synthase III [Bacteroidota bacterium]